MPLTRRRRDPELPVRVRCGYIWVFSVDDKPPQLRDRLGVSPRIVRVLGALPAESVGAGCGRSMPRRHTDAPWADSSWITAHTAPELYSPSASSSKIRRRSRCEVCCPSQSVPVYGVEQGRTTPLPITAGYGRWRSLPRTHDSQERPGRPGRWWTHRDAKRRPCCPHAYVSRSMVYIELTLSGELVWSCQMYFWDERGRPNGTNGTPSGTSIRATA